MKPHRCMTLGLSALAMAAAIAAQTAVEPAPAAAESEDGRDALRAFYTSPPVIPHEVTTRDNGECLHCHADTRTVGGRTTVVSPHAQQFSNCQQCHVGEQSFNDGLEIEAVATTWVGLEAPGPGTRAYEGAPPTIPHRLFMRESCLSCHHPDREEEHLRMSHPERSQCLQCHALMHDRLF